MNGFSRKTVLVLVVGAGVLWAVVPSVAELADVFLKNGVKLRGDVRTTDDEVIVRNLAGQVRVPRGEVERIVPVDVVEGEPTTQPADTPGTTTRATSEPAPRAAERPPRPELPPAPPLSDEDIQKLKLLELKLDGPAEMVRVRFKRKGKQKDLPAEVLDQLKRRPDFRPEWEDVLTRGQPHEKLQLIVRLTGTKHADRIEIENDPETFDVYRRRILPLVERGCARAGCHAGKTARLFRLPMGATTGTTYAYTTFVLLDQMRTADGPLLDRTNPETSVLLGHMLPQEGNPRPHPPVGRGPDFRPVIVHRDDRSYGTVLGWINRLMTPHPDYGLEYENPYAGLLSARTDGEAEEQPDADGPEQPASQPTSRPAGDSAGTFPRE